MKYIKVLFILLVSSLSLIPVLAYADSDGPEWRGVITQWPGSAGPGLWVIGGVSFQATTGTFFEQNHGGLTVGACAEVKYYSVNGVNYATSISSESSYYCGQSGGGYGDDDNDGGGSEGSRYGILQSFTTPGSAGPWVIGGTTFYATASTRYEMDDGGFTTGGCVEYTFVSGSNRLLEVGSEPAYKCSGGSGPTPGTSYSHIYGVLNSFPSGTLVGTWVVSGTAYTASSTTHFEQKHGPFFVGACVEVKYTGLNSAVEISTEDSYKCMLSGAPVSDIETKFAGIITAVPAGYTGQPQFAGQWTIGGRAITSDLTTRLSSEHGPLALNACAEVEVNSAGFATEIKTERPYKCGTATYHNSDFGDAVEVPTGYRGVWIIRDTDGITKTYHADGDAEIPDSSYNPGSCVHVEYYILNGVHRIRKIENDDPARCSNSGQPINTAITRVYAVVDGVAGNLWTVGGVQYQQTGTTVVENNPQVGDCVKATYTVGTTPPYTLLKLEKEDAYKCQVSQSVPTPEYKHYGTIEALPVGFSPTLTTTWIGDWKIGGITYKTDASTSFRQEYGFFAVGSYVEVKYITAGGIFTATRIETHVAPGAGRKYVGGILTDRPDSNGNGQVDDWDDWVVNGTTYPSDPNIEIGDLSGQVSLNAAGMSAVATPSTGQAVLLQIYRGTDGQDYVIAAAPAQSTYLPVIFK